MHLFNLADELIDAGAFHLVQMTEPDRIHETAHGHAVVSRGALDVYTVFEHLFLKFTFQSAKAFLSPGFGFFEFRKQNSELDKPAGFGNDPVPGSGGMGHEKSAVLPQLGEKDKLGILVPGIRMADLQPRIDPTGVDADRRVQRAPGPPVTKTVPPFHRVVLCPVEKLLLDLFAVFFVARLPVGPGNGAPMEVPVNLGGPFDVDRGKDVPVEISAKVVDRLLVRMDGHPVGQVLVGRAMNSVAWPARERFLETGVPTRLLARLVVFEQCQSCCGVITGTCFPLHFFQAGTLKIQTGEQRTVIQKDLLPPGQRVSKLLPCLVQVLNGFRWIIRLCRGKSVCPLDRAGQQRKRIPHPVTLSEVVQRRQPRFQFFDLFTERCGALLPGAGKELACPVATVFTLRNRDTGQFADFAFQDDAPVVGLAEG